MATRLLLMFLLLVTLSACARVAQSRLNPVNWFGNARTEQTLAPDGGFIERQDIRPLVDQVIAIRVDQTPGGAILRATGLPLSTGHFDAELVSTSDGDPVNGVLEYEFRIRPPAKPGIVSSAAARRVEVATFITTPVLAKTRRLRVRGARNAMVTSR